jgi:hypothetical protein
MRQRDDDERKRLVDRRVALNQRDKKDGGLTSDLQTMLDDVERRLLGQVDFDELRRLQGLPPPLSSSDQIELSRIENLLDGKGAWVVDPLFIATRAGLKRMRVGVPGFHQKGLFPSQQSGSPGNLTAEEQTLAAVYGILELDNLSDPSLSRFAPGLAVALGEFADNQALFAATMPLLAKQTNTAGFAGKSLRSTGSSQIRADEWVRVVRTLAESGIQADDRYLPAHVDAALSDAVGADDGAPPSSIVIDLPDLEESAEVEIQVDNLHAAQALYFGAMLEELRMWEVVEKLVELNQFGYLPLGRGDAGNVLYRRWRSGAERLSDIERRNMYARVFGFSGGDPNLASQNRDYADLFLRFISAVSSYYRQFTVDQLLRASIPVVVSQEQVRKAGRDLAANLSLYAYGMAYSVATEIQSEINQFIKLLSDREIRAAYGARDMWQVIDQVATLELGGARNSIRYRTMANAGAIIIRWLAKKAQLLASPGLVTVIDLEEIRNPPPRNGTKPTNDPNDQDLINACEQWLAVTGTPDLQVEEYAQPNEGPMITSAPVRIPQAARDLLSSVGIQASARDNGNGNGGRGYGRY